ncbi:MAG: citryl-CoA lyase [Patescibacteria group bacterium]|nr:MAG: citryl-CoA lyase [Patescibacteria group bacterium]
MNIKTRISHVTKEHELLRGHDLISLIGTRSFTEVTWLLLRESWPTKEQAAMLESVLVAAIDHGAAPVSSITARAVASSGNDPHVALAAGILAQGTLHGGAIENAARFFLAQAQEDPAVVVSRAHAEHRRLPGYGHKLLAKDRRSEALCARAKALGVYGAYAAFAERVEAALNTDAKKPLPLNVDGAMAAVLLDMGFGPEPMRGIFALARLPGLLAQIIEERETVRGPRRLSDDEITYEGPASA